jgi:hypothetical protein
MRDDAEAGGQKTEGHAQRKARRPRHAPLGGGPQQRECDDDQNAKDGGRGSGERQIEQVGGDQRQAGDEQRALEACGAFALGAVSGVVGLRGVGCCEAARADGAAAAVGIASCWRPAEPPPRRLPGVSEYGLPSARPFRC